MSEPSVPAAPHRSGGTVLPVLATAQFLMALDMSVMNVSIANVAHDVGTTVSGVQTAITLYTLVMAMFMLTGGKVGSLVGRRRAFMLGAVVYACGSAVTALAPSLPVLVLGWSLLEGLGAVLIMPAIVALVATNFDPPDRPRAYGLIAASAAIAVAVGPLIGGLVTTYSSWRWVFVGEVVVAVLILLLARRLADPDRPAASRVDLVGVALSALGLGLFVFGVLRSSSWGWLLVKQGAPGLFGISLTAWLMLAGALVTFAFTSWERHRKEQGKTYLVDLGLFQNRQLTGGLVVFFFQYLLQAGLFFIIPLFLSVALGLSALSTGLRLIPLSVTLLLAALAIPRLWPDVSPRRVVRLGLLALLVGIVVLICALDAGSGPEVTTVPLILAGLGIGALASQLGSVTVSAVPEELSPEVGGLQNTSTNLGASLGTAIAGSVLLASLTTTFLTGIAHNPAVPPDLNSRAQISLAAGVPFLSDAQVRQALAQQQVKPEVTDAVVTENTTARITSLRVALGALAALALLSIFFSRRIPERQPRRSPAAAP